MFCCFTEKTVSTVHPPSTVDCVCKRILLTFLPLPAHTHALPSVPSPPTLALSTTLTHHARPRPGRGRGGGGCRDCRRASCTDAAGVQEHDVRALQHVHGACGVGGDPACGGGRARNRARVRAGREVFESERARVARIGRFQRARWPRPRVQSPYRHDVLADQARAGRLQAAGGEERGDGRVTVRMRRAARR